MSEGGFTPEEAQVESVDAKVDQITAQLLKDINLPEMPEAGAYPDPTYSDEEGPVKRVDSMSQDILKKAIDQFLESNPAETTPEAQDLLSQFQTGTEYSGRITLPTLGANFKMMESLVKYAVRFPDRFGGQEDVAVGVAGLIDNFRSIREGRGREPFMRFTQNRQHKVDESKLKENPLYQVYDKMPKTQWTGAIRT